MKRLWIMTLCLLGVTLGVMAADNFVAGYDFNGKTGLVSGASLNDLAEKARFTSGAADPANTNRIYDGFFTNTAGSGTATNLLSITDNSLTSAKILDGTIASNDLASGLIHPVHFGADASNLFTTIKGYTKGANLIWVDTNTISVGVGEGLILGKYWAIDTNTVTLDLTAMAAGNWSCRNIYIDYSASTFPSTLSLTNNSYALLWNTNYQAYYNHDNSNDLYLGSCLVTNGKVAQFIYSQNDYFLSTNIFVNDSQNTTYTEGLTMLEATNVLDLSSVIPSSVTDVYYYWMADCAGSFEYPSWTAMASYETYLSNTNWWNGPTPSRKDSGGAYSMANGYGNVFCNALIPAGTSKRFYVGYSYNCDDDANGVWFRGWRIKR